MIYFRYRPEPDYNALLKKDIVGYTDDTLHGVMSDGDAGNLKYCAAYLICELEYINGLTINKNPIVVVAQNDRSACELYTEVTGKIGSIMEMIRSDCSKLKVEIGD